MSPHATCEDARCTICAERESKIARKIERGLRPAGQIRQIIAKIKESARRMRQRKGQT